MATGPASDEMKPIYLFGGDDQARIEATRSRLRARAESEGGGGALEVFEPAGERSGPDAAALAASLAAMSLTVGRRYILADGVERWKAGEVDTVAAALAVPVAETTLVLIARGKAPAKLVKAVEAGGGEARSFEAPSARDLPGWVVEQARARGFRIARAAATELVARLGPGQLRLANELDRLALWATPEAEVTPVDLEAMVADSSETMIWSLSDALIDRDAARALMVAERLVEQHERVPSIVYQAAGRLRQAHLALSRLEAGEPPKEVQAGLKMHPYAARQLVARVRDADVEGLRAAIGALADLELWTRGGSDYDEEVALTLALRDAAGA